MELFPYDLKGLKGLLENNINFIETFFKENTFEEGFLERVVNNTENEHKGVVNHKSNNRIIPVDIIYKNSDVVLIFEIPGLNSKEDVSIKLLGSSLVIEGDIKRKYSFTNKERTKFERNIGHFYRKINLPYILDNNRINAKYQKGLLEVRIPILKSTEYEDLSINFYKD